MRMNTYPDRLLRCHRQIDWLIDTSRAHGKQGGSKLFKRVRLRANDTIAESQYSNRDYDGMVSIRFDSLVVTL